MKRGKVCHGLEVGANKPKTDTDILRFFFFFSKTDVRYIICQKKTFLYSWIKKHTHTQSFLEALFFVCFRKGHASQKRRPRFEKDTLAKASQVGAFTNMDFGTQVGQVPPNVDRFDLDERSLF